MTFEIFNYNFMQNAFIAGTIAAVFAAVVGYFAVLRGQNFASHALSHVGFAGAAGAGLLGLNPAIGLLILTLLAAMGMGVIGEKAAKNDTAVGMVLVFALGLGVLFLYLYADFAGRAMGILFGNLLGVSRQLIESMFICSVVGFGVLALIARPLLFVSLEPELAEAKGISLRFIAILFLMLLALAVTEASQVVGVLLVFTLLIGPAAIAIQCSKTVWGGIVLSVLLGVSFVWVGIIFAYYTDWPVSFWISALSFAGYLLVRNFKS